MARPRKQGLGYFTLDCNLDTKVEMLLAVHGNDGFAVWIRALQEIYQTASGQLDLSDPVRRATLAKRCLVSEEKMMQILIFCASKPVLLFDENLYQKRNLFSSNGITKRMKRVQFIREQARQRQKNKGVKYNNYSQNNPANNESQNNEYQGNKPNLNHTIPNHTKRERESPPPPFEELVSIVERHIQANSKFSAFDAREKAVKFSHLIASNGMAKANGRGIVSWESYIFTLLEKEIEFEK